LPLLHVFKFLCLTLRAPVSKKFKNLLGDTIGPKDQGILYEHRERVWGDHSNLTRILDAVSRMKKD
jgi:hypothetical protein